MAHDRWDRLSRRDVLKLIGAGGALVASGLPAQVFAQARKNTLVIAIDISDTITLDPARIAQYTSPMSIEAAYETLVTMTPGDYINLKPALATKWTRTADGKGWRFTIRDGVKFASGTPMTVEDVKWSLDRVINLKDQPSLYVSHIDHVAIVDKQTIDIILKQAEAASPDHHRRAGIRRSWIASSSSSMAGTPAPAPRRTTRPRPGSTTIRPAPARTSSPSGSATRRSSLRATSTSGAGRCRSSAS